MHKLQNYLLLLIKSIFRIPYAICAVSLIFLLSFFVGLPYLTYLRGTDSLNALSFLYWFNKWWPNIPYWYPLQNGGVVPLWGYPFLAHFLAIIVHRFSQINLIGSLQLIGFISVPLTALGLYFFVSLRLKNQTVGLIGSVFYILSPITWVWLYTWGFFAESVSYIWVFPALIFYDYAYHSFLKSNLDEWQGRAAIILASLSMVFMFLTHPNTFFGTIAIILVYSITVSLYTKKHRLLRIIKGISFPLIIVICSLFLLSFIIFDFRNYSKPETADSFANYTKEQLKKVKEEAAFNLTTPLDVVLGLKQLSPTEFKFGHNNIVISPAVWIPAIPGLILAFIYSPTVFGMGLLVVGTFLIFWQPDISWYFQSMHVPFWTNFVQHRLLVFYLRLLVPVVSAFGLWAIWKAGVDLLTFWIKKGKLLSVRNVSTALITTAGALVLFIWLVVYWRNKPEALWKSNYIRYGPSIINIEQPFNRDFSTDKKIIDLCSLQDKKSKSIKTCSILGISTKLDINQFLGTCAEIVNAPPICRGVSEGTATVSEIDIFRKNCRIDKSRYPTLCPWAKVQTFDEFFEAFTHFRNWIPFPPKGIFEFPYKDFEAFVREHKDERNLRIDISPAYGGVVQSLNLISDISMINLYTVQLSLLGPYWGYQQQEFYGLSKDSTIVTNLAKYFGTKYVFASVEFKQTDKFKNNPVDWESVNKGAFYKLKNAPDLYTWLIKKPVVLVIGNHKQRAFEPLFRTAMAGVFGYDDGLLIQGKEAIDDYSLDELKRFQMVMLFGYSYRNRGKAFSRLEQYVKEGGNLFISTGWQYTDKDWELENTPEFFPVTSLTWSSDTPKESKLEIEKTNIISDINSDRLPPLIWAGQSWGVSIPSKVRDWAEALVTVDGKPLIVGGTYGSGKVVWTGLNLPGHITTYEFNKEEINLFNKLLTWLASTEGNGKQTSSANIEMTRGYPDKITFAFEDTISEHSGFYWRESYFQDWHAKLISGKSTTDIPIYKAGPGFMYLPLLKVNSGDLLILEFSPGIRSVFYKALSVIVFMFLCIYVILGNKIFSGMQKLTGFIINKKRIPALFKAGKWLEKDEEEY